MLHNTALFTIQYSALMEIFDIPGTNESFIFAIPVTRRLFGWIAKEYLGISNVLDHD